MKDFRNLIVWQKAHQLALKIYNVTKTFPPKEIYVLTSQVRRAALSIPTNLAESCGRFTDADFARFGQIAFGSASEVEYLILFSRDIELIEINDYNSLNNDVVEVKKMLSSLLQKLRA
ncbi:four helix bundle protein [Bacteroidota bacterium]